MKKILLLFILILFTGCGNNIMKINNIEAKDIIDKDKEILLLGVRTKEEYDISHIEGSINIPHTEIDDIEKLIDSKEYSKILIYCRSENRSNIVSKQLIDKGYKNIYNMYEGYSNWIN